MSEQGFFGKLFGGQHEAGESSSSHTSQHYFTYSTNTQDENNAQEHLFSREEEIRAMEDLLDKFTSMELSDAIDMIMLGPSTAEEPQPGSGFARYAARLFSEVGASRIRHIAAANELSVIRLSGSDTFWMRMPFRVLSDEDLSCVLAAESAMNRLLFIKEAFAKQSQMPVWGEEYCFEADLGWMENIILGAESALKGLSHNPLLELYGTEGKRGGEWDVRTRFAVAIEQMRLPFRLVYRFDCNVEEGLFRVDYTLPLAGWLPQHRYNWEQQQWQDMSHDASRYAEQYGVALGALLAAHAFGTSVNIRRVHLVGHPRDLASEETISLYVNRLPFVSETISRIVREDTGWLQHFVDTSSAVDSNFDRTLRTTHPDIQNDTRMLPSEMRKVLFADIAAELDVISDMPSDSWDSVHAAEADRQDSPLAAIAVLESVAAQGDAAMEDMPQGTKPLYCSDAVSRFLLSLTNEEEGTRYRRYSDAAFRARSLLCDLYCDMEEPDRAIQQAEKCIELAPTSTVGYTDLANALFAKQEHAKAIPCLEQALSLATYDATVAFIYYRLAFALWQADRHKEGLAAYVLSSHHNFGRPEILIQEMDELLAEMAQQAGGVRPQVPSVAEARDILQQAGIAPAPTRQVRTLISSLLIPLVEARFLDVAAPLARMIAMVVSFRDEMFVVASSLEQ